MNMTPTEALRAIQARIDGVYDDPTLMMLGPLETDPTRDIMKIVEATDKDASPKFELFDQLEKGRSVAGEVEIADDAILIKFAGFTSCNAPGDGGEIIMIEIWDGRLKMSVWSDVNKEDPTHDIDLEAARTELRED